MHPGGDLVLTQSMGTDITASVRSHHFSDAPFRAMEKYLVEPDGVQGEIVQTCTYAFAQDGFFETCKRRVVARLGLGKDGVRAGVTALYKGKVALAIIGWVVSWLYCCFRPICWPVVAVCFLMRPLLAGIGHEGIHGRVPFCRHFMDWMLMFRPDDWHKEHCLEHHPHCKRLDLDPDEILPFMRLNEGTEWASHHRVQVFVQILMAFGMGWGNVATLRFTDPLIDGKGIFYPIDFVKSIVVCFLTQFLPLLTHPDGVYAGLLVHFAVVVMANCFTLHCFHLSHINEDAANLPYDKVDGVDWGEHQLRTTCNWAGNNLPHPTGMLEMQIEHHLFPSLTYAQQAQISDIVKETAEEFNIPYRECSCLSSGLWSHVKYMQQLSHPSQAKKLK